MSYYSDAVAVMYETDYDEIREKILNTVEDEWDRSYFENAEVSFKNDLAIIKWESVNHFGRGSTSMKMFLDFLDTVPHNFIRIGEGVDDQLDIERDMTDFQDINEYLKFNILGYSIAIEVY